MRSFIHPEHRSVIPPLHNFMAVEFYQSTKSDSILPNTQEKLFYT